MIRQKLHKIRINHRSVIIIEPSYEQYLSVIFTCSIFVKIGKRNGQHPYAILSLFCPALEERIRPESQIRVRSLDFSVSVALKSLARATPSILAKSNVVVMQVKIDALVGETTSFPDATSAFVGFVVGAC